MKTSNPETRLLISKLLNPPRTCAARFRFERATRPFHQGPSQRPRSPPGPSGCNYFRRVAGRPRGASRRTAFSARCLIFEPVCKTTLLAAQFTRERACSPSPLIRVFFSVLPRYICTYMHLVNRGKILKLRHWKLCRGFLCIYGKCDSNSSFETGAGCCV